MIKSYYEQSIFTHVTILFPDDIEFNTYPHQNNIIKPVIINMNKQFLNEHNILYG